MRVLHTSDWHLGHTLHGYDRAYEHQRFLDWLLDTLEAEAVDALLIPGDVFDNANPSAATQHQLYRFLTTARARMPALSIVVTAGNHDSPARLEAPSPFFEIAKALGISKQAVRFRFLEADAKVSKALFARALSFLRSTPMPSLMSSPT